MQRLQRSVGIARSLIDRRLMPLTAPEVRAAVLEASLAVSTAVTGRRALNALEIGTMFGEGEGLSTLRIARAFRDGCFVSIELNPQHIAQCRAILAKHDPTLAQAVRFVEGHSVQVLPSVLADLDQVDFALVDGVSYPEVCLREFELILPHLTDNGLIVVDDAQEVPASEQYRAPRTFGKATLILPTLILAEHCRTPQPADLLPEYAATADSTERLPASERPAFAVTAGNDPFIQTLQGYDYAVVGGAAHWMLIVGRRAPVQRALTGLAALRSWPTRRAPADRPSPSR